jgi:arginine/ornithine N-succinyltransferase beta subunit
MIDTGKVYEEHPVVQAPSVLVGEGGTVRQRSVFLLFAGFRVPFANIIVANPRGYVSDSDKIRPANL